MARNDEQTTSAYYQCALCTRNAKTTPTNKRRQQQRNKIKRKQKRQKASQPTMFVRFWQSHTQVRLRWPIYAKSPKEAQAQCQVWPRIAILASDEENMADIATEQNWRLMAETGHCWKDVPFSFGPSLFPPLHSFGPVPSVHPPARAACVRARMRQRHLRRSAFCS